MTGLPTRLYSFLSIFIKCVKYMYGTDRVASPKTDSSREALLCDCTDS